MSFSPFSIARLPRIEFGRGVISQLPTLLQQYGQQILLVTGQHTLQRINFESELQPQLSKAGIRWELCQVEHEPSPQLVDEAVRHFADRSFDAVVGIGGGSVLDAAKAIAGLLKVQRSVMDYLEGVGPELAYSGPAVPFIALPTTAGTGSEATKNAVLSVQGHGGFKKSFRDDALVAQVALVDPALLASCPAPLIAANGMDALTQLMESYVSLRANVLTDALAVSALRAARDSLIVWYQQGADAVEAQDKMAYAALVSGITLAQVGLGSVHGLAAPLGAFYPIPHGVVCGSLVADATQLNIETMLAREPDNIGLKKYARLGDILCERRHASADASREALVQLLHDWTAQLNLPRLSEYGVNEQGIAQIVANARGSSMKTNPIVLTDDEIQQLVRKRL